MHEMSLRYFRLRRKRSKLFHKNQKKEPHLKYIFKSTCIDKTIGKNEENIKFSKQLSYNK